MSTRSRIGILHEDGTTETVYCHCDGYPDYMMPTLTEHYSTIGKVQALLALGDLSFLGECLAPEDGKDATVAYHRDRGERLTPAQKHSSIDELTASDWQIDYFYLFDKASGAWLSPIRG